MTKVIENLELLKKLQPYLWETEYKITQYYKSDWSPSYHFKKTIHKSNENIYTTAFSSKSFKTLTLEEAYDKLPRLLLNEDHFYTPTIAPAINKTYISYDHIDLELDSLTGSIEWRTLLQAIEKMLEYLIDNNLLKDE
jgi:hypothetical protein